MDERNGDRRHDAGEQAEPDAAGEGRHRRRAEGADQDLALEADVDDARALGPQAREAGQDQRRAEPDAGTEDDDERVEEVHRASPVRSAAGRAARQQHRDRTAEHVLERAGEQHHQALDDDDHVAADLRLLERELGAALIEHAEQDRGENDADRMGASHQRDRDADEAEAGGVFEDQPMLLAEDHVDRHARRRARPTAAW